MAKNEEDAFAHLPICSCGHLTHHSPLTTVFELCDTENNPRLYITHFYYVNYLIRLYISKKATALLSLSSNTAFLFKCI